MKVLDLRCANGHRFEGWFASDEAFMEQNGGGLVECPLCADKLVTRMPSAPRLNLSSSAVDPVPARAADLQAAWMKAVRQVIANTENVGERFAEEARRIHYGEAEQRGIRGQASREDRQALEDEGIEVHPLPLPAALKEPLQ
jgi:hypothetical protein